MSNPHDPLADLLAAVKRDSVTWLPENEGDQVAGVVVELTEISTEFGVSPVVVLLEPSGREVRVNGFGAVLRNRIYSSDIEAGDLFAARYLGKSRGRNGKDYADYRVVVRDRDGQPKRRNQVAAAAPSNVNTVLDELDYEPEY